MSIDQAWLGFQQQGGDQSNKILCHIENIKEVNKVAFGMLHLWQTLALHLAPQELQKF